MKKSVWSTILKFVITIATAALSALGLQAMTTGTPIF
ncbi:MAG: smalltalk protein [Bacteroides sp.]|nr:smalltalk protein [Bacteroides sp.]